MKNISCDLPVELVPLNTRSATLTALLVIGLLLPIHAFSAVHYVMKTPNGNGSGNSWANAFSNVDDALDAASAGDSIYVASGIYVPYDPAAPFLEANTFSLKSGVAIYGGFPVEGGDFSERDILAHPTTLSGDYDGDDGDDFTNITDNLVHVVTGSGTDATATLDGFTIVGGYARGSFPGNVGGAIYNSAGSPTIRNCSIVRHSASSGGAVYSISGSAPTFINCAFRGNRATNNGAAVFTSGATSSLNLINCLFQGNHAGNGGGALYNQSATVSIVNGSFQGNRAGNNGGAIYNQNALVNLDNTIIWRNQAGASTASTSASVFNTGSTPTYRHCLVDNSGGSGSWNATLGTDGGNNIDADPRFGDEIDPAFAPLAAGDLRLGLASPAFNVGSNLANAEPTDLAGYPRIANTIIDLGAHERQFEGFVYVDHTATGNHSGTSWADAFITLQDALAAGAPGDAIHVAEGTYYPDEGVGQRNNIVASTFNLPNSFTLVGGFPNGGSAVSTPLDHPTVLSGDIGQSGDITNDDAAHVLTYRLSAGSDANAPPVVQGFTITKGGGVSSTEGGGFYNVGGSPEFTDCIFDQNRRGGLYNIGGSPEFTDCVFSQNQGSAVASENGGTPVFEGCTFTGNSGFRGGAIRKASSNIKLYNCLFSGNRASNSGGAIYNELEVVTLINCTFQGNGAGVSGGAIENRSQGALIMSNCIVWNNAANGTTTSTEASIRHEGTNNSEYKNCLIANYSKATLDGALNSANNLDPADPRFFEEVEPALAPVSGGNLRLQPGSPAVNVGNTALGRDNTDLDGYPRFGVGSIDLGPYEQQAIYYVDSTQNGNGLSWGIFAFHDLQDALAVAGPGSHILVAEGTYYPDEGSGQVNNALSSTFQLQSGLSMYGGFAVGGSDFDQRDPVAHPTNLSGDLQQNDPFRLDNASHILTTSGVNARTLLEGFIITAGGRSLVPGSFEEGGGLFNVGGSPEIVRCVFTNNSVTLKGGAIYNEGGAPTISECSFYDNQARLSLVGIHGGGAIYSTNSTLTLSDCSFRGNDTGSLFGGALLNVDCSPIIENCSFTDNSALTGGAIENSAAHPTIINCSFQGNGGGWEGGAIKNNNGSHPKLVNCSFQGNRADEGGALFNRNSSPVLINSIVWSNAAGDGTTTAQASVYNNINSTPSFSHCLIANSGGSTSWVSALGTDLGNNIDQDPLFLSEIKPQEAPTRGGDLRLGIQSPAVDVGLTSTNSSLLDLAGNARVFGGSIDLGAIEQQQVLYVDGSASGTGDGLSWSNAFSTVQTALALGSSSQLVAVAEGTYYPDEGSGQSDGNRDADFRLRQGFGIFGGYPAGGGPRDHAANPTILSGDIDQNDDSGGDNANNAKNVVFSFDTDDKTILDGFTITRGGNARQGGGLFCQSSQGPIGPNIVNCRFDNNTSNTEGGAVYIDEATPTFVNCVFSQNRSGARGGAVSVEGEGTPTFINCLFEANEITFFGGAVFVGTSDGATFIGCAFQGNRASNGGALVLQGEAILVNCSFQGNRATDFAGAINCSTNVFLERCIIWNNMENGVTTNQASSMVTGDPGDRFMTCLIQHWSSSDLGGVNFNLDGTNPGIDPLFLIPLDPLTAPAVGADLRLQIRSSALNAVLGQPEDFGLPPLDLLGNPRVQDEALDLGAYEGANPITFALLYPTLSLTGDENGNGRSNYLDFAAGGDPTDVNDLTLHTRMDQAQLSFSYRNNASDVYVQFQKAPTVLGPWRPLVEQVDYINSLLSSSGARTVLTLDLSKHDDMQFYRESFSNADVFPLVVPEMVEVGNANNADDPEVNGFGGNSGAVPYNYAIGKYEVTNAEYVPFLNAVDPNGVNATDLYYVQMGSDNRNGGITFTDVAPDGEKYRVKAGFATKPVVYVSFYDAMRFCNWLHNGAQVGSDTENGAYTLLGGTARPSNAFTVERNVGAKFVLPTEDEWYKAAYHQPQADGGDTDNYWLYPTGGNSAPNSGNPPGTAPAANFNNDVGSLTDVGTYTMTEGFYGTFDMAGNVAEWTETPNRFVRVLRGGEWFLPDFFLRSTSLWNDPASADRGTDPGTEVSFSGFRIARP